jgi:hypothetical protein
MAAKVIPKEIRVEGSLYTAFQVTCILDSHLAFAKIVISPLGTQSFGILKTYQLKRIFSSTIGYSANSIGLNIE